MDKPRTPPQALPSKAGDVACGWPDVWSGYVALGEAYAEGGPLDLSTIRLVKLALAVDAGSEGGRRLACARALEEGHDAAALRQVALLAIPTLGFPQAVAALSWMDDLLEGAASAGTGEGG